MTATKPAGITGGLHPVVLVYIFCVVVPLGFHLGPLALTSLRVFLIIMILPLSFRLMMGHFGKLLLTDYCFFLYTIWMLISLMVTSPSQAVLQLGSVGAEFLGGYMIGRAYIRDTQSYIALSRFLVGLCLVMLPFAIFETLTGNPVLVKILRSIPGIQTVSVVMYEKRMGLERVQLMFAHPIHYGLFCSVVFAQSFVALRGIIPTTRRYLNSAVVALSCMLSLSSGALLSIVLQSGLILWDQMFRKIAKRWWILTGAFALAYLAIDLLSNRSPLQVFLSYATFSPHNASIRMIIFDAGMVNVWANPLFGIGMADWERPDYLHSASVDNFWLLIAMRYGIPGFVLLAVGCFWALPKIMLHKLPAGGVLSEIRKAWVFTFCGMFFTLATVHVWTNIYSFTFFLFGAGMWLLTAKDEATDQVPETTPQQGRIYSRFAPRTRANRGVAGDPVLTGPGLTGTAAEALTADPAPSPRAPAGATARRHLRHSAPDRPSAG